MRLSELLSALALCAMLVFSSCGNKNQPQQQQQAAPTSGLVDSLDSRLSHLSEETSIPGFAVTLVEADRILFTKGYGKADLATNTAFDQHTSHTIASISKTFIAVAIMQMVEAGKLQLDYPVNAILPFEVRNPHYPDLPISIRHLVTHSSSLNDDFDDGDKRASWLVDSLPAQYDTYTEGLKEDIYYYDGEQSSLNQFLIDVCTPQGKWYSPKNYGDYAPGTHYEYSNTGAALAARIVEIVSGESFAEYTQKHILKPLGMTASSWHYGEEGLTYSKLYAESEGAVYEFPRYHEASYPDGQLKTTAIDLGKFLIEMVKGASGQGQLLQADSYRMMFSPQLDRTAFDDPSPDKLNDEYAVGVFWAQSEPGYILHAGGMIGVYSIVYFNPKTELGFFAFANLAHPDFGKILDVLEDFEGAFVKNNS